LILDRLTVHNFGVYAGKQEVVLTPTQSQPVILIGALNGAGKTTLLDALQVVLYGRHARCTSRARGGYGEYLRNSIHRYASSTQGASIELAFRYRLEGKEERFEIRRTWGGIGPTLNETVEVERDGHADSVATERWQEFVEQFIPNQISDLFFFDGEKIESLADPERSAELLRVGVHALLGLDLVDDLIRSLKQVERRHKLRGAPEQQKSWLIEADKAVSALETRGSVLTAQMAEIENQLQLLRKRQEELRRRFKSEGGELFDRREHLYLMLEESRKRVESVEARLREWAAGMAPLLLVQGLLSKAKEASEIEDEARRESEFASALQRRDDAILKALKTEKIQRETLKVISAILEKDRQARLAAARPQAALHIQPRKLSGVSEDSLAQRLEQCRDALKEHADAIEMLLRIEKDVTAIPDEKKIQILVRDLDKVGKEITELEARGTILRDDRLRVEQDKRNEERIRSQEFERLAERRAATEIERRIVAHSVRSRDTLQTFRQQMRRRHVSRLESFVTQSFHQLLRKHSLVDHVSIHPETFALTLHGKSDLILSAERLSAGERQLLAVSVLWGLAKASGRQLPAVIDTPLGRLDSEHRSHLVQNYFPVASHQVILLSTDEEIDGRYYHQLKNVVAREYLLSYSDSAHASSIEEGYFATSRLAA
jgi:DNA sulfur modification protein DndD